MDISGKKNQKKETESYIVYAYKDFSNNKNIKNLLVIAEDGYPNKDAFQELFKLFNNNDEAQISKEDNYLYLLLNNFYLFNLNI